MTNGRREVFRKPIQINIKVLGEVTSPSMSDCKSGNNMQYVAIMYIAEIIYMLVSPYLNSGISVSCTSFYLLFVVQVHNKICLNHRLPCDITSKIGIFGVNFLICFNHILCSHRQGASISGTETVIFSHIIILKSCLLH